MIINLNGQWDVEDNEKEFHFIGNVPGTVQGDLVDLGILPHPYVGTNEKLFERLESKSWTYVRTFKMDEIADNLKYKLVFKGIDTLSNVYLNDRYLGKTEDMFLEYRFDVSNILKKGENLLKVVIDSPVNVPRTLERNNGLLASTHEESSRPYIRKAQYSYGWDWGARVAASGIWRDVYIEAYPDARLKGCTAYLENLNGTVKVSGYVEEVNEEQISSYGVEIFMDDEKIGEFPVFKDVSGFHFDGNFVKENVELWFPVGMGKSVLHDFKFDLLKDGKVISSQRKRIGLRTVKIVKENDEEGETFIFEINGKRIFAKGADWIPADNVLSWLKKADYDELISLALNANMNMLRVWGGGIYEDDEFYTKCDELGILVWQDFMFACAEYPDHLEWFRKLADQEVRENVINLRYHPSIVLWCGNNENNWGFDEWEHFTHKINGEFLGNRLYLQDFPKICAEEDPSRPYWPSSPFGGSKPNAQDAGDIHVWNVWSMWDDYGEYLNNNGKFVSEFGFQAAPDPKTIDFFAKDEDKNIFSDVMLSHNKQVEGQERVMKFIHNHFGLVNDFDSIVYLSQINQGEAIKTGVEHWRKRKYRTAGTLYWQFNDSWPVFSWSALDYFKRPKALYYYTKRFYSPILPMVKKNGKGMDVFIVNDLGSNDVNLEIEIWSFEKGKLFEKKYEDISIAPDSVVPIDTLEFNPEGYSNLIVYEKLTYGDKSVESHELFGTLRNVKLPDPKISFEKDGSSLKIKCENVAYGVVIRTNEDVVLSDNFFPLVPSREKIVENVKGDFEILSMYDFLKKG